MNYLLQIMKCNLSKKLHHKEKKKKLITKVEHKDFGDKIVTRENEMGEDGIDLRRIQGYGK